VIDTPSPGMSDSVAKSGASREPRTVIDSRPPATGEDAPPAAGDRPPGTIIGTGPVSSLPGMPAAPFAEAQPQAGPSPSPSATPPPSGAQPPVDPLEAAALGESVLLSEGQRIQQYELLHELGRGGMGQVFLARDTKLGRKVAIKFMHKASTSFTERFLVEARATARCNHENIVVIHEVNEFSGMPFMVLEYLEGEPLNQLMQGSKLPAGRAVELMVPVVRALVRAHEFNIVHRDLKPENIFVQRSGIIKVLDFGIAKLFSPEDEPAGAPRLADADAGADDGEGDEIDTGLTREGAIVGTLRYMSPEQWGMGTVDHRTDIWSTGLILYEMVAGENPLERLSTKQLMGNAARLDKPMPGVGDAVPDLPGDLERVIDRCLAKRADQRFRSADELLEALEPLVPARFGRKLAEDESPYPGLTAFQESDAGRFFGRTQDILSMEARIREQPLLAVVGPSGVGKSSFVRAGVVPALKASGESWEVFSTRPGRSPLEALATMVSPVTRSSGVDVAAEAERQPDMVDRLRGEPGYLGTLLRSRARRKSSSILIYVDQFEELYTLVSDPEERAVFTACLAGMADAATSPLRVVVSMRSDFLDRVAEDRQFMEELTRGLIFLQAPNREGLREAITQPAELAGYSFASSEMVEEMLDALQEASGALPLLQFAAANLWEGRDRGRRQLTRDSYESMGGIAVALASHANEVYSALDPSAQRLVRTLFQRLVTPDGTRAIVDVSELKELSDDPAEVRRIVDYLVQARLLVVQTRSEEEGPAVEIVHESLIESWPTLRRWRDESHEDAAILEQLRNATRQWQAKGRPQGLLWRAEAMDEARRWYARYLGRLPQIEEEYLDAVFALATRAGRIRRAIIGGAFAVLVVLAVAATVGMLLIRGAEKKAVDQAEVAKKESQRSRAAEKKIKQQLDVIKAKEREKQAAQNEASQAKAEVATGAKKLKKAETKLNLSYEQLQEALKQSQQDQKRAEKASKKAREETRKARAAAEKIKKLAEAERKAKAKAERLLAKERASVKVLLRRMKKIATEL
jgi:serine/threonine protein kinase